jgi:hypothetical protein
MKSCGTGFAIKRQPRSSLPFCISPLREVSDAQSYAKIVHLLEYLSQPRHCRHSPLPHHLPPKQAGVTPQPVATLPRAIDHAAVPVTRADGRPLRHTRCSTPPVPPESRQGRPSNSVPGSASAACLFHNPSLFSGPSSAFQPRPALARALPPKASAARVTAPWRRLQTLVRLADARDPRQPLPLSQASRTTSSGRRRRSAMT